MTNFLISGKRRVTSRGWWFFLFLVTLTTILSLPRPALAQKQMYGLSLWMHDGPNNYNLEARAGQDSKFFLDVRNDGNQLITNIKLSSDKPQGWAIVINPAEIASLKAGSVNTVDVNITPVGGATADGQQVTFTAQSNEVENVKTSFFITVKPAQVWIWVWIAVGVVVVAGFVLIYLKFGRQ